VVPRVCCILTARLKESFLWDGLFCLLPKETEDFRKMEKQLTGLEYKIQEMAERIRALREITGLPPPKWHREPVFPKKNI
jgi:hypothetical protein